MPGTRVDILGTTVNRFLFGPNYQTPLDGLFIDRHWKSSDEGQLSDLTLRTEILKWIAEQITLEGVAVPYVTNPKHSIAKSSPNFVVIFWWSVVRTRLWPIGNDNTLQHSHASLVACLIARYGVNVGQIIALERSDRALSDRACMPFSFPLHKGWCSDNSIFGQDNSS